MGETKIHAGLDNLLVQWLTREIVPGQAIARSQHLLGGVNHEMVAVTLQNGERFVVRRYRRRNPCALELALSTHMAGLVPAVEVAGADLTGAGSGEPTLVYRYVEGRSLETVLERLTPSGAAESESLGRAVGKVLAQIGTIAFPAPGAFAAGSLEPDGKVVLFDPLDAIRRAMGAGNVQRVLSGAELDDLQELAAGCAGAVNSVADARQLVHMDFNPKNVVVHRVRGHWEVAAVLDWEFAFSGSPLTDVGNMLRFAETYPREYVAGFHDGYADAGGDLPDGWLETSRALDLFTLADILTQSPEEEMVRKVAAVVRRRLGDRP